LRLQQNIPVQRKRCLDNRSVNAYGEIYQLRIARIQSLSSEVYF